MSNTKKNVGAVAHKKGVTFRVWAPFATSVAVSGAFNGWEPAELASEGDGYWFVDVKGATAGQEYKYVIKNGEQTLYKNDPRALQVTTSAGNSVIVDPEFDWGDDDFTPPNLNEQVLYELHIGTFNRPDAAASGTFQTAMDKLNYLADLGVNMIELMPVTSMPQDRGWGYATDYIYAVESLYGGRYQLLEFVRAAHQKGIGVILDVVYNHFSPDGGSDMWQFDGWSQDDKGGIYFYNDWRSTTPWGETRPDYGRPEVRQYIFDNVRLWLEDCHLDGLRADSTIYLRNVKGWNDSPDTDIPDGWNLLQQLTTIARKIKPQAVLIAEDVGANAYLTKSTTNGGAGFGSQWQVTFPAALRAALDAIHDEDRNLGGICNELSIRYNGDAFQRVIYSDSHDTDANGGRRLSEEISPGNATSVFARKRSLLAAGIALTAPGIPMLFQGQEFMEGGSFNDWQALDWTKAEQFAGIVTAHKHLVDLRLNRHGNTRGLTGQSLNVLHCNDAAKLLAYHRWEEGGAGDDVIIVCNFANRTQQNYQINFPRPGSWHVRFNSSWKGYSPDFKQVDTTDVVVEAGAGGFDIGPYSILILSQD